MIKTSNLYQASEFARMTGVTVRALHHYDRLGLLKPSGRSAAGYRLYGERDFARLQQIVTLKFLGLPLKQIKSLLERDALDLTATLRMQREMLAERRRQIEAAIEAIKRAERQMASESEPDWEALAKIIEVIEMQNNWDWVKKYYTEEQLAELSARGTPEVLERGQREWAALIKEVEQAISEGVDPASERAQALAARWKALIEDFTGGNPEILASLKRLYADQANWPAGAQRPYTDEVSAFISKAAASDK
ncbi:MAG: MerR family transcriptional regulator [Pyrinomonadaceae bacterium]|nr:MerR family transcriptional regulator [Pyrinomonadaceae bacterium]